MERLDERIEEILKEELKVPESVERRIEDTCQTIRSRAGKPGRRWSRGAKAAAAAAVVCVLSVSGVSAAYLAENTDFFESVFGNSGKENREQYDKNIPDGKGGEVQITVPEVEYAPVEEEAAAETEEYMATEPVVLQKGEYTIELLGVLTDGQGVCYEYALTVPEGTNPVKDEDPNNYIFKGLNLDTGFTVMLESESSNYEEQRKKNISRNFAAGKLYLDEEKSSGNRYVFYETGIWFFSIGAAGDIENIYLTATSEEYIDHGNGDIETIEHKDEAAVEAELLPLQTISVGDSTIKYSQISMNIDGKLILGSNEGGCAIDYCEKIALIYKDGTEYTVYQHGENEVNNSGYIAGTLENDVALTFNRLVNWGNVEKIVINGQEIPVEESIELS